MKTKIVWSHLRVVRRSRERFVQGVVHVRVDRRMVKVAVCPRKRGYGFGSNEWYWKQTYTAVCRKGRMDNHHYERAAVLAAAREARAA